MIEQIYHVGLTVTDMDRSVKFYRDILGLKYQGEILMEGKETELMFRKPDCMARVAYLNGAKDMNMPPVELIQFIGTEIEHNSPELFRTSISELCFYAEDADKAYRYLLEQGVECMSEPQEFDFRANGFGRSRAFYFKDPDGIILEIMQPIND